MKCSLVYTVSALLLLMLHCNGLPDKKVDTVYSELGKASWYGPGFQGKITASGEKFDMNKLTAAHKVLEFGTIVRVTNINNKKKVIVKINDRGPFTKNRIIDLSKKAAERIDMLKTGIADVKIEVIEPNELKKLLKQHKSK